MPIIPTPANATELTELRSARSKVFALANGTRRLVAKLGRVHFQDDDGQLKDIETDVEVEAGTGELIATKLPYRFRLHQLGIGFDYESRAGGIVRVALVGIDGQNNFDRTISYDKTRNKNRVRFADVRTDLDIVIEIGRHGVRTFRIIKSATAPRNFRWAVEYDASGASKIVSACYGKDSLDLTAQTHSTDSTPQLQQNGRMRYFNDESWTGNVKVIDPVTRIPSWKDTPTYPVIMDPTVTEDIAADADDGHEANGAWVGAVSPIRIGKGNGYTFHLGFRFTTLAIDQGATINSATLKLNYEFSQYGGGGGTLYGSAVDNAAQWSGSVKPSNRTKTTASATFARHTTSGIKSFTVTSIVQEIINRAGWASGNSISLFALQTETTDRQTRFEDFSGAGTDEAQLEIDYTAGGGGGGTNRRRRSIICGAAR